MRGLPPVSFAFPQTNKRRRLRRHKDERTIDDLANGMTPREPFKPCQMILLSKDVRQMIFKLLMARHRDMHVAVAPFATYSPNITGHLCPEEDPRSAQLLAVCSTFHKEGIPILYGMNAMLLRNATRVAQLRNEDWWRDHARRLLQEIVIGDCEKYFGVAKQAITLHGDQLQRVGIEPPPIVVCGGELLEMSGEEVKQEALRVCLYAHPGAKPSQDLGDAVTELTRQFPAVDIVLRIVARIEPWGRNINPPAYFEYSAADVMHFDLRSDDGVGSGEVSEED